jgi:hypothetical protein
MSDQPHAVDWDNEPRGCTHRCLKPEGHLEDPYTPHFYGYQIGPHAAADFLPEGYAIVKIGEVPSWMNRVDAVKLGQGRTESGFVGLVLDDEVYRLSTTPESSKS